MGCWKERCSWYLSCRVICVWRFFPRQGMAGCEDAIGEEEVAKGSEVDEGGMHCFCYGCGKGKSVALWLRKGLVFLKRLEDKCLGDLIIGFGEPKGRAILRARSVVL